ncbi:uncharacterized protein AMSG_10748 [Thecamonas trahens ATCC 50062]|uniref:Uncharacterized protein n=1 Tax=Thecamonas trahens ATCC 50062 TaxID=461836 RepID=A0A0L0DSF7_THETB|nr:hypothetical protein AMSG_10748 [Thecamonas trahens ATCC 50062]KNC55142.1 hypothetical protein AMSG_10748 [Thecamonas trahens ATCC 50062]|eukprot:XP_013753200.1 hypothetical protein AMSG_10748 [Thecamonas trahens ATCC 50062]
MAERDDGVADVLTAASLGDTDKLRWLTKELGVSLVVPDGEEGPVLRAVAGGHHDTVRFLLAAGVSVDEADADGRTALHRAARSGDLALVQILVSANCDIDARDSSGSTRCMRRSRASSDFDARNHAGIVPLHYESVRSLPMVAPVVEQRRQDELDALREAREAEEAANTARVRALLAPVDQKKKKKKKKPKTRR